MRSLFGTRLVLLLALPGVFVGGDEPPAKPRSDLQRLQGRWQAEVRTPVQTKMTLTMTIDSDRVTWTAKHLVTKVDQVATARLAVSENESPRHWDLTNFWIETDGPRLPNMRAVYRLDGDELTLCVAPSPGAPRPTEIVPDEGTWPLRTIVFRRMN